MRPCFQLKMKRCFWTLWDAPPTMSWRSGICQKSQIFLIWVFLESYFFADILKIASSLQSGPKLCLVNARDVSGNFQPLIWLEYGPEWRHDIVLPYRHAICNFLADTWVTVLGTLEKGPLGCGHSLHSVGFQRPQFELNLRTCSGLPNI